MGSQSDFSHLIVKPAEKIPFFTPKTDLIAGTAISPNPPLLFQPLKVRGLELQNRILVSPMAQFSASDGHVTPWHLQHLGSIAMRGPSLTWAEATAVSANSRTSLYDAGLWKESHVDAWRPVVEFVHSQGQKIGIQFCHAGRKGSMITPWLSTGGIMPREAGGFPEETKDPSGIPHAENYPVPKAMTVEDIHQVIADFAQATERAVRAGFDAINIHGAHGYLIHSFLSPVSNKRTDQYGGSFENRARLLLEVIDAMRAKMPDGMPLFLRISATEWLDESRPDIESLTNKDSIKLAKLLVGKIDALDVSTSGIHPDQKINMKPWSDTPAGIAYQAPFALEIKKAVGDDFVVNTVGNIKSGAAAEELLQAGVDLVAVGRPFLKNPGTVLQFADELGVEVATAIQHAYVSRGRGFAAKKA